MELAERSQIISVLEKIANAEYKEYLASDEGARLRGFLDSVRTTLQIAGNLKHGAPARPLSELVDLYGYRLLSNDTIGEWIREMILRRLPRTKFNKLKKAYSKYAPNPEELHGNSTQYGTAAPRMAAYWRQGSNWAYEFCEVAALPERLASHEKRFLPKDELVLPADPLPQLHDFQIQTYSALIQLLSGDKGRAAMLSLPTGAGKTRVTVEAICDHLATHRGGRVKKRVLWIAHSEELLQQAWECFRQVWQVPPQRAANNNVPRLEPLRIVRMWGDVGDLENLEIDDEPMVFIASVQKLHKLTLAGSGILGEIRSQRLLSVVIDEAHSVITPSYRKVLSALGLRSKTEWMIPERCVPTIGLTSTPWRTKDAESERLKKFFQRSLVGPEALGARPIETLQNRQILSLVSAQTLHVRQLIAMKPSEEREFERFHTLPMQFLQRLGLSADRNAVILKHLLALPASRNKVLIFACSQRHANLLAVTLNRMAPDSAAVVTSETPRAERANLIERFRNGDLRFLCNVTVLATGFDAPTVNVVCIARPITSVLLYEQMAGRGLRGVLNGGTKDCLVLDVQDQGLPIEIMSYARVLKEWDGTTQVRL